MSKLLLAAKAVAAAGALVLGTAALVPVTAQKVAPAIAQMTIYGLGAVLFILAASTALCFGLCRAQRLHLGDLAQSDRIATIERGRFTDIYHTKPLVDDEPPAAA
jgi:hypothetical protein